MGSKVARRADMPRIRSRGSRWEVTWTDDYGPRSRSFPTRADAGVFAAKVGCAKLERECDRREDKKRPLFGHRAKDPRRETAYHEAGHVVAAEHFGELHEGVSIVPDERSLGRVPLSENPVRPEDSVAVARRALRRRIIVALAGYAAHRRLGAGERRARAGAWNDFDVARGFARRGGLSVPELLARAESLVARRWRAIAKVAEDLLVRSVLHSDEILLIVQAAGRGKAAREAARWLEYHRQGRWRAP